MFTNATEANEGAAVGAEQLADAFAFYEGPDSPLTDSQKAEVKHYHSVLFLMAERLEGVIGAAPGSLAIRPNDGTPKT